MAFGGFSPGETRAPQSDINMVPLIDVMLVLLIVFIVTLPVARHAVTVNLPQASSQPGRDQPETVRLSVDAQGRYHWNQEMLSDEALQAPVLGTVGAPGRAAAADRDAIGPGARARSLGTAAIALAELGR